MLFDSERTLKIVVDFMYSLVMTGIATKQNVINIFYLSYLRHLEHLFVSLGEKSLLRSFLRRLLKNLKKVSYFIILK